MRHEGPLKCNEVSLELSAASGRGRGQDNHKVLRLCWDAKVLGRANALRMEPKNGIMLLALPSRQRRLVVTGMPEFDR
jgi:hypothetical protein